MAKTKEKGGMILCPSRKKNLTINFQIFLDDDVSLFYCGCSFFRLNMNKMKEVFGWAKTKKIKDSQPFTVFHVCVLKRLIKCIHADTSCVFLKYKILFRNYLRAHSNGPKIGYELAYNSFEIILSIYFCWCSFCINTLSLFVSIFILSCPNSVPFISQILLYLQIHICICVLSPKSRKYQ